MVLLAKMWGGQSNVFRSKMHKILLKMPFNGNYLGGANTIYGREAVAFVARLLLTTCFHKGIVGLVFGEVLVTYNSLKTITIDKLYQRIDYYCMLIYTRSLIWPTTRPHYSFNFD